MATQAPLLWTIRKVVWNSISLIIFRGKKAKKIPLPPDSPKPLKAVPLSQRIPGIKIDNILMADRIPPGETSKLMYYVFRFRLWLYAVFPPVQPGLPQIDADMQKAMDEAFTPAYAKLYPRPVVPEPFQGDGLPDLGELAMMSPYSCFIAADPDGGYSWDFRDLNNHEIYDHLEPIGCRVRFEHDTDARRFRATGIETHMGTFVPGDHGWPHAVSIALCAASTQISLVQHFNWVHLACGGPLSIATRNQLPKSHVMCRLVWPHMFGTQNSNYLVTMAQMLRNGDFETIFSFTHKGMCDVFSTTYDQYRASLTVPKLDWAARGLPTEDLDRPSQDNFEELYDVMETHARHYIDIYYENDADLQADETVAAWLDALEARIPNGIQSILDGAVTRASVARLVAGFIYMASVQHEVLGTMMWNYQMWVDKNPVRILRNGNRIPLDVFQRLLNANFNLNVDRAKLCQDFSYMALDDKAGAAFKAFKADLDALEARYEKLPDAPWRVMPSMLEANINA